MSGEVVLDDAEARGEPLVRPSSSDAELVVLEAARRELRPQARAVLFSLGLMVGLLVTALLVIVLGSVIPVTPPMAFFWAISIAVATGLAATLLPFHRFFTTEKIKALEQKRAARSPAELQPGGTEAEPKALSESSKPKS